MTKYSQLEDLATDWLHYVAVFLVATRETFVWLSGSAS